MAIVLTLFEDGKPNLIIAWVMFLMLKSCKRSAAGEISVSGVLKQFLRRTQKKKTKNHPTKYVNSFKLYAICWQNVSLFLERNSEIQGLLIKKNPKHVSNKETEIPVEK